MHIRNAIKIVIIGVTFVAPHITWSAPQSSADTPKPNILFILGDDLGWGHVGWQNSKVKTPNLDRLAANGIKLDQHYVAPVCSPTRVALLTGRYWSRFGCNGPLGSHPNSNARAMPTDTQTIATALKTQGYRTALIGKWHLGAQLEGGPERYGFDYFYGIRVGGCTPLTHKWLGIGPSVLWREQEIVEEPGHITDLLGQEAARWIGEESGNPFFMYLSFTAPHVPLQESDRWMDLYKESAPDKGHQLYWAAISHLDEAVGRVLTAIERTGQSENTMVVFFGDNGSPGQQNLKQVKANPEDYLDVTLPGGNLPLRGKKGDVYEGGIRTPAFISWPAMLKPKTCDTPLHVTDWMPTLCSLVDHRPAYDLKWDGRNIMPLLKGMVSVPSDRSLYTARGGQSAMREGHWKLISKGPKSELYNLAEDIGETNNRATEKPELVQRLRGQLKAEIKKDTDAKPKETM